MKDGYTTVARFLDTTPADLACACLAAEGIEAHLDDENVSCWLPYLSAAVGGIKLCVPEGDVARSRRLLAEEGIRPQRIALCCPQCGSHNVRTSRFGAPASFVGTILLTLVALQAAILFRHLPRSYACRDCRHRWREERTRDRAEEEQGD